MSGQDYVLLPGEQLEVGFPVPREWGEKERPFLLSAEVKEGSCNTKNRLIFSLLFKWLL